MYQLVEADTPEQAKEAVWNEISEGWTYHWENKEEFMKNAQVTEIENNKEEN